MKSKLNPMLLTLLASSMICGAKGGPPTKQAKAEPDPPAEKEKEENTNITNINQDFEEDAGVGGSEMNKDDLAIPRLVILQALSPACQKKGDAYVEGAEPGEIMDTVSQEIFSGDDGFDFIPCTYRKTHIEWKLRENGGGFINDLGESAACLAECSKDDKGRMINSAGNQIVATAEYFGFKVDIETGSTVPYVISMTGANIKHSRKLNTQINTYRVKRANGQGDFNPAMFYRCYRFTTQVETKNGNTWFGWNLTPSVDVITLPDGMDTYNKAKAFRASVVEGAVQASKATSDAAHEADDSPM